MRGAVLDLGTNTFNLLIADISDDGKFHVVISTKRAVKLGFGGINANRITNEAIIRGENAISSLYQTMTRYKPDLIFAFATSAIRSAVNGHEFTKKIEDRYGFQVNVISGDKEAEYIYKGVRNSGVLGDEKVLILDIGGGSNEFIIADNNSISWKQSFNIGIARLIERFHPHDPILPGEIIEIEQFFEEKLVPLFEAVKDFPVSTLIGSSGSFESFSKMIAFKNRCRDRIVNPISLKNYFTLHQTLVGSNLEGRKRMKGLVLMRVEMIVLASVFVNYIIQRLNITKVIKSDFSLKEGVIDEIYRQHRNQP